MVPCCGGGAQEVPSIERLKSKAQGGTGLGTKVVQAMEQQGRKPRGVASWTREPGLAAPSARRR